MHQVHYKPSGMARYQQGVTLIEVLVSMLLMAIIGLGAAYISGRTAVTHRDQNLHLHTLNQMRQYLESSAGSGCTNNVDLDVAGKKVTVNCIVQTKDYNVITKDNGDNVIVTPVDREVIVVSPTVKVVEKTDSTTHWNVPIPVEIAP
ncbi:prepilin-type N-terminal cleavage/methylation domain-containing protein [Acinetobacter indicus]|uniref:prepilin-type N-terminal cleavage/methylation domain-containing protein n=1 Tax=Acinetobacter indicus TaxID=756892 RepID=UPI002576AC89|nr:prepilin-type N-terminal cleavage/methylation domain-containing protein [Acinetobacter indicus]MDM1287093.1 prepilin-type N-terminal cleavage/methylation domain-containing protein [Acinetobacter indicus]